MDKMGEGRLKKMSPHIFSILFCVFLSIFSFYLYDSYVINSPFIVQILIFSILFSTPLFVMILLFIFGSKYLSSIDIELYGGLSGRIILLASLIVGNDYLLIFSATPFYGFITPLELYAFSSIANSVLYEYMRTSIGLTIYNTLLILTILSIVTFYLYLIFFGRGFQEKVMKIYYIIAIIFGFIFSIGAFKSRFLAYLGGLQLLFVFATMVRLFSQFKIGNVNHDKKI